MATGGPVRPEAAPQVGAGWIGQIGAISYKELRRAVVEEFELAYLRELMAVAKGNVSLAARTARMDRSHLTDLLKRPRVRDE